MWTEEAVQQTEVYERYQHTSENKLVKQLTYHSLYYIGL